MLGSARAESKIEILKNDPREQRRIAVTHLQRMVRLYHKGLVSRYEVVAVTRRLSNVPALVRNLGSSSSDILAQVIFDAVQLELPEAMRITNITWDKFEEKIQLLSDND